MPEIELTNKGKKIAQEPTAGGSVVLRYLGQRGSADVEEMSRHFRKRPRTIKQAVNRLSERGLVQAREGVDD